MKTPLVLVFLTVTTLCLRPAGHAADVDKDKPAHTPQSGHKQKPKPFRGKVSALDKTAKTVTLEEKEKSRTFQITSATRITRDGKPAVMDDVIVGRDVAGLAKEAAGGKWEVVTLNIGPQPGKAKDAKAREKK